ncbi:hypothetical protein [Burkholderia ambifaria]|uniref:hypothetical protein n=1 Tax=Burkholderia ambifaria TaxID=152480 RepID=UPI00158932E9|nr:hypothetical protein [Burkholderia ambifaria]
MATKPKRTAVSTSRISFESQVFRKKDLPASHKTEKGRAAEGIWGMQELQINGEDFAVAFGRTWEGSPDPVGVVTPTMKKAGAKKASAKNAARKVAAKK